MPTASSRGRPLYLSLPRCRASAQAIGPGRVWLAPVPDAPRPSPTGQDCSRVCRLQFAVARLRWVQTPAPRSHGARCTQSGRSRRAVGLQDRHTKGSTALKRQAAKRTAALRSFEHVELGSRQIVVTRVGIVRGGRSFIASPLPRRDRQRASRFLTWLGRAVCVAVEPDHLPSTDSASCAGPMSGQVVATPATCSLSGRSSERIW